MLVNPMLFDLEENRKRLEYYSQLRSKAGPNASPTLDKWIQIYTERQKLLERNVERLGIRISSDLDDALRQTH